MKILHLSPYALRGGCEKNCYLFIQASPDYFHTLLVFGKPGPMTADWNCLGISVTHLDILNSPIFGFKINIQNQLKGQEFDLIIYWSTLRLSAVLGAIKLNSSKVRVYLGNPLSHTGIQLLKEKLLEIIWPRTRNVLLLACSNYVKNSFTKAFYFKNFEIKTFLNPVEFSFPKTSFGFKSPDQINIGMVARLDPIKNHEILIQALPAVLFRFPSIILHLVGDGVLRNSLKKLRFKLGLTEKIIFYGDVKNVYKHLEAWDAFIYSTTIKEGLGSTVLEAMANSLPCLLPDLPIMHEIAPNGVKINWFEAGNVDSLVQNWIKLLENSDQFQEMSESVYKRSLDFTPRKFVEDYLQS